MKNIYIVHVSLLKNELGKSIAFDKNFNKIVIVKANAYNEAINKAKDYISHNANIVLHMLYVSYFDVKRTTICKLPIVVQQSCIDNDCYEIPVNKMFSANEFALLLSGNANVARNPYFLNDGTFVAQFYNGSKWIDKRYSKEKYENSLAMKLQNIINLDGTNFALMMISI